VAFPSSLAEGGILTGDIPIIGLSDEIEKQILPDSILIPVYDASRNGWNTWD
jgi:hypothetical protein